MSQFAQNPYDSEPKPATPVQAVLPPGVGPPGWATKDRLKSVSLGLKLVYNAIVCLLVIVILYIAGAAAIAFLNVPPPDAKVISLFSFLFVIMVLVCWVASFVGKCYCISVPRSGPRGLAIATVVLETIYVICIAAAIFLSLSMVFRGPPGFQPNGIFAQVEILLALRIINVVSGLASYFCFLTFISALARYIERFDVRRYAIIVIVTNILFILMYLLATFALVGAAFGFNNGPGFFQWVGWVGIAALIMVVILICMYTSLLRSAFRAVDEFCREKQ